MFKYKYFMCKGTIIKTAVSLFFLLDGLLFIYVHYC